MALDSFANLQTSIASWLNRDDLTAVIPDFISLCEVDMNKVLRVREMLVHDVTDLVEADEAYENLPADFMELKSIRFNTTPIVVPVYRTPTFLEHFRRVFQGSGGTPCNYSILGNQLLFDRVPTGSPEIDICHFARIPSLSVSQTSNGILEKYPDLYLYGSLMAAEPYLKNDPRLATWTALYQTGVEKANLASANAEVSPGPLIMVTSRSFD